MAMMTTQEIDAMTAQEFVDDHLGGERPDVQLVRESQEHSRISVLDSGGELHDLSETSALRLGLEFGQLPFNPAAGNTLVAAGPDGRLAFVGFWAFEEDGAAIHCECGKITGEACPWYGDEPDTVLVEWMPEHLRASHEAAGNRGEYPHNGAIRVRCEAGCAADIVEADPDWAAIIEE